MRWTQFSCMTSHTDSKCKNQELLNALLWRDLTKNDYAEIFYDSNLIFVSSSDKVAILRRKYDEMNEFFDSERRLYGLIDSWSL